LIQYNLMGRLTDCRIAMAVKRSNETAIKYNSMGIEIGKPMNVVWVEVLYMRNHGPCAL